MDALAPTSQQSQPVVFPPQLFAQTKGVSKHCPKPCHSPPPTPDQSPWPRHKFLLHLPSLTSLLPLPSAPDGPQAPLGPMLLDVDLHRVHRRPLAPPGGGLVLGAWCRMPVCMPVGRCRDGSDPKQFHMVSVQDVQKTETMCKCEESSVLNIHALSGVWCIVVGTKPCYDIAGVARIILVKKNDFQEPRWPSRCFQQFSSGGASVGCQSFNQAGQGTRSGDRQVRKSFLGAGGFEQQAECLWTCFEQSG